MIASVGNFCRHCKLVWRSEFDIGVKFIPRNHIPVEPEVAATSAWIDVAV
jgi:hypothetical protein